MRSNKSNPSICVNGFTLLELLVVLAIMMMLVVVLYGGLQRYAYRQSFESTVSQAQDQIVEARARTLASVDDTTYGVYVSTSSISFFSSSTPSTGTTTSVIELPGGVTASSSFSNGLRYVSFARLTGVASATGTITFVDSRTTATSTLTIGLSGLVQ